jgi:hypothetical protein
VRSTDIATVVTDITGYERTNGGVRSKLMFEFESSANVGLEMTMAAALVDDNGLYVARVELLRAGVNLYVERVHSKAGIMRLILEEPKGVKADMMAMVNRRSESRGEETRVSTLRFLSQ